MCIYAQELFVRERGGQNGPHSEESHAHEVTLKQVPSSAPTVTLGAASMVVKLPRATRRLGEMPGRAEWSTYWAVVRHTGETQDNSGWNLWKPSHVLGPPSTHDKERAAAWTSSPLSLGHRPGCPPASIHGGRGERNGTRLCGVQKAW